MLCGTRTRTLHPPCARLLTSASGWARRRGSRRWDRRPSLAGRGVKDHAARGPWLARRGRARPAV